VGRILENYNQGELQEEAEEDLAKGSVRSTELEERTFEKPESYETLGDDQGCVPISTALQEFLSDELYTFKNIISYLNNKFAQSHFFRGGSSKPT